VIYSISILPPGFQNPPNSCVPVFEDYLAEGGSILFLIGEGGEGAQ